MRTAAPLALALVVAAALAGPARADRFERAENNFKTNCVGCHSLGWGTPVPAERSARPVVDLTQVARRLDERVLRRFLEDPARERPATRCQHGPLERTQVDDLVAFLMAHADAPPPAQQVIPARSRFRKMTDPATSTGAPGAGRPATARPTSSTRGGAR